MVRRGNYPSLILGWWIIIICPDTLVPFAQPVPHLCDPPKVMGNWSAQNAIHRAAQSYTPSPASHGSPAKATWVSWFFCPETGSSRISMDFGELYSYFCTSLSRENTFLIVFLDVLKELKRSSNSTSWSSWSKSCKTRAGLQCLPCFEASCAILEEPDSWPELPIDLCIANCWMICGSRANVGNNIPVALEDWLILVLWCLAWQENSRLFHNQHIGFLASPWSHGIRMDLKGVPPPNRAMDWAAGNPP